MTIYYYILFFIFTIIATMILLDNNVGVYFVLIFKIINVNIQRFFWMVRLHPKNFITTWLQNQKYDKIARELARKNEDKMER
jgi:hypothetical protein